MHTFPRGRIESTTVADIHLRPCPTTASIIQLSINISNNSSFSIIKEGRRNLTRALNSATQPQKVRRKVWNESFNTRFPLPNVLNTEYSVKLIFFYNLHMHMSRPRYIYCNSVKCCTKH